MNADGLCSEIKVRIIEYDASGFNDPETEIHREIVVKRFRNHPRYDPERLTYDVSILFLRERLQLTNNNKVNAACLPGCNNMFDYKFSNGTGVRCWVAGWGKDGVAGKFQFIQNKVDVPLFDSNRCDGAMREALRRQGHNTNGFQLSRSELCAGGEKGKDACDGDGGAPLVCEAKSGRWYVVGLVTWGVGCADQNVPGVYANVHSMLDFILEPECRRGIRC